VSDARITNTRYKYLMKIATKMKKKRQTYAVCYSQATHSFYIVIPSQSWAWEHVLQTRPLDCLLIIIWRTIIFICSRDINIREREMKPDRSVYLAIFL